MDRRTLRERPFQRAHELRVVELAERKSTMPKDVASLLRWFAEAWQLEIPDELHTGAVWRDRVSASEGQAGIKPVGASETGALAYAEDFRRRLENSPSELDHADPEVPKSGQVFYVRPIAAALGRIARSGKPLMARSLIAIGLAGFDWRKVADRGGWPHEMFEVYMREALIRLWREHREWARGA